ncbi:c-type cytochrome domain-containing protein [Paraglaciecola aquimarina]|uniref:C-type cytochrome domain-containing protein n=1 Tax=Paraglaciecola aquimarina TaxID=1235557 RepID=A0ABU3STT9_9ALTE|nr:c-type cytochrome domain-containing protein [Paraglaciecola aquimarina]MDU0353420.1 c-type cytochrome domain-containing protein [Paraglaciecola aquimarina]
MMFSKQCIQITKLTLSTLPFIGLVACTDNSLADAETAKYNLPEVVDYNFHIKPILSDTCFLCHGPDATNAKAGLSLNTFERATKHVLESGSHAIVPGKPEESEALQRITSTDPNMIMPPPNSNLTLSDREKALISKWIKQGAEYKKHWSFITPEKNYHQLLLKQIGRSIH